MTLRELLSIVFSVLLVILIGLLAEAIRGTIPWLRAKGVSERLITPIAGLARIMDYVVKSAQQTTVRDLKDPARPGEWTDLTIKGVRSAVTRDVRVIGAKFIDELANAGMNGEQIDLLLDSMREAKVLEIKQTAPVTIDATAEGGSGGSAPTASVHVTPAQS